MAYIQSDNELSNVQALKDLARDLPDYMVPSQVVKIDKIPLTPASKVDKNAYRYQTGKRK